VNNFEISAEIKSLIHGRNVALVGNSRKVLGKAFDVDAHDVVIRMNGAWKLPKKLQASVGNRIHLMCMSGHKKEIDSIVKAVPLTMWMSPKNRDLLSEETKKLIHFYPIESWEELFKKIGSRPSTGCMAVNMISDIIGEGHLTLYGFDFFEGDSWHTRYSWKERFKILFGQDIYTNPHNGQKEAEYIKSVLPASQFTIIKP
jgi:hypothetical protein